MADKLGALGGSLGGTALPTPGGTDLGQLKSLTEPDEASLKADAAGFGEGVRYLRHEKNKDPDGWVGYTAIYEFDDIRKLRLDPNSMPGQAKKLAESAGGDLKKAEGAAITFDLEGDLLTVKTHFSSLGLSGFLDKDRFDQAEKMGMPPSQAMQMGAGMTRGMRMEFAIAAADGIAETDATHVEGNRLIMSRADIPKVLQDPDFGAFVDRAAADPATVTAETSRELVGKLEGLTIETKDTVKVKLK